MRYYLDQTHTPKLVAAARRLGIDITDWRSDGMEGTTDDQQLTHAASQGRCIVTCNFKDFIDLATWWEASGRPHAGILLIPGQVSVNDVGSVAQALQRFDREHRDGLEPFALLWLSRAMDA